MVKHWGKKGKTFQDLGIQQIEALKALKPAENKKDIKSIFPKEMRTNEIKAEIDEMKKWEEKLNIESK